MSSFINIIPGKKRGELFFFTVWQLLGNEAALYSFSWTRSGWSLSDNYLYPILKHAILIMVQQTTRVFTVHLTGKCAVIRAASFTLIFSKKQLLIFATKNDHLPYTAATARLSIWSSFQLADHNQKHHHTCTADRTAPFQERDVAMLPIQVSGSCLFFF